MTIEPCEHLYLWGCPYCAKERATMMTFGEAIEQAKLGKRVARSGWNGKGMWITYSPGVPELRAEAFWAHANRAFAYAQGGYAEVLPCFTMKTADNKILMGWLASQTDMLATDWEIVP